MVTTSATFVDGKLAGLMMTSDEKNYGAFEEALSAKWGSPDALPQDSASVKQRAAGFGSKATWTMADGKLFLERFRGAAGSMVILYAPLESIASARKTEAKKQAVKKNM